MERAAHLDLLRESLRPTAPSRMLFLEGEPGVGKTTLLRVAARMAARNGLTVLTARGSELESELPFGVALQLLGATVRGPEGERLLSVGAARLAAPLFAGGYASHRPDSLLPTVHGLSALTCALSDQGRLAMLIDDAQWADEASLRFLLYLAARLDDLGGLVMVSARPDHTGDLLGRLREQNGVRHIQVQPLSRAATAELIATVRPADDHLVSACHEVTLGNPLFLAALLPELARFGPGEPAELIRRIRSSGPEPVADRARRILAGMVPEAGAVAHALLTLGDGTDVPLLAAHAGLDSETATRAVVELARAGLLDDHDPPSFCHPIVATALRATRHPAERVDDHRRAAEVLHEAGASAAQQATHLLATRPAADAGTVATLRSAADEAMRLGDTRAALRLLDRADAEPPPPGWVPAVAAERARAAAAAGRADAPALLASAAALSPEPERSHLILEEASAHYATGAFAAAARTAQAALDAGPADGMRDELEARWAAAAMFAGTPADEVHRRIAQLLTVPADRAGPQRLALSCTLIGVEMLRRGDRGRIVASAQELWAGGRLLERLPVEDPALWSLTAALLAAEDYETLDALVGVVGARTERRGLLLTQATSTYVAAMSWWQRGDLAAAADRVRLALEARQHGWEMYLPALLWIHASLLLEAGEHDAALRAVTPSAAEEGRWSASPMTAGFFEVRGRVALAAGRSEAALGHFRTQGTMVEDRFGCTNPSLLGWRGNAAIAAGRTGDAATAEALIEEELRRAADFGAPRAHGRTLRCAGLVRGGSEGIEVLREAVRVLEGAWARLEHAQALVDLGASLRALGHRVDARGPLAEGLAMADTAGARALAERARAELRAVGARPRRAQVTGVASLTPAERRVADLVAGGCTNRAAAGELFVTVKAVEFHLSGIYRKLGVTRAGLREALAPTLG